MSYKFEDIGIKLKGDSNPKFKSKFDNSKVSFHQTRKDLEYVEDFVRFVKGVENLIRLHPDYTRYIAELKMKIDLKTCSFLGNIDDEMASIEMHHGPILTLFDVCYIICNYYLIKYEKINTIAMAEVVLQEHFENNIQVVMLSKTAHQLEHRGEIYINPKQAWGNIDNFIKKYKEGINKEYKIAINKALDIAQKYDSNDFDMFNINEKVTNFKQ